MVGVAGRSGVGSGGPRPGGGRPKGSVNSESIKLQERALASGYAPPRCAARYDALVLPEGGEVVADTDPFPAARGTLF
jgi:hypothetical protein